MINEVFCYYYTIGSLSDAQTLLFLALIAVLILGLIVQASLKSTFNRYSKVKSSSGVTAEEVARHLLYKGGCDTQIARISGNLTDNFNPRTNTVSLSQSVYGSNSIAAIAVTAHEIGHVMQHKEDYTPIKIRSAIFPLANFGSNVAPFIVIIGAIFGMTSLAMIGVWLFAAVLGFQLVTLPVEFNASRRAIDMLVSNGFITAAERPAAKKVLRMAALTYVVGTLSTVITLLRLFLIARGSRRR